MSSNSSAEAPNPSSSPSPSLANILSPPTPQTISSSPPPILNNIIPQSLDNIVPQSLNNNNNDSSSLPSPIPTSNSSSLLSSSPSSNNASPKPQLSSSPTKHQPSSSDISDMTVPLVVGIITGVLFCSILLFIACVCCTKKKKKPRTQIHYYSDTMYNDSDMYSTEPQLKWHNKHKPKDHSAKGSQHGVGNWHAQSPPVMDTDEMSSPYSSAHGPPIPPPSPALALSFNKNTFTYEELLTATNGFAQGNLLGQGGFGYVHKGVLANGKEVAVKQLKSGSNQGEREFHAEVDIISRVHHRHLVSLVGYCVAGAQRLLVYEFVSNRTLEYHLHGKGLPVMDWHTRLKIALGSAKGLAYLHEDCHPRIIHRDIKSANILLDFKFEAMVADFGLAKLTTDNHTHVSTRVMGTFGYLAPEYASSGKLTEKSDVFSYGVMLLELITGRRPVDNSTFMEDSLVDWARPVLMRALGDGNFDAVSDPRMNGNYDPMEMARMAACAAAAIRHSAKRRPKMSQIVRALEGDVSLEDLNEGIRPGQSMLFGSGSDYDQGPYMGSMNRMRKAALRNTEYSSDYGMMEYEQRQSVSSNDAGFTEEMNAVGQHRHKPYGLGL